MSSGAEDVVLEQAAGRILCVDELRVFGLLEPQAWRRVFYRIWARMEVPVSKHSVSA